MLGSTSGLKLHDSSGARTLLTIARNNISIEIANCRGRPEVSNQTWPEAVILFPHSSGRNRVDKDTN
jgi:hypothetical protein